MRAITTLHRLHTTAWTSALAVPGALAPSAALAHTRARPTPETLWSSWNIDPLISIGILFGTWIYLRGIFALHRKPGGNHVIRRWRVWAFMGAMLSLIVALISPLDALGAALFSAHMVQHLLLFLVTPMLLAMSRPTIAITWAIPDSTRKWLLTAMHRKRGLRTAQALWSNPLVVWMIFTGVLWIWHVPALYDATLQTDLLHQIEHLSFMAAAFMFWSWLMQSTAGRSSRGGLGVLFVFTSVMQSGILGAVLTFAGVPIYSGHEPYTEAWNLTGLEDQQLAGLIMWIPMGLWFTVTTIFVFIAWLRDADRSVRQWESQLDSPTMPESISPQRR